MADSEAKPPDRLLSPHPPALSSELPHGSESKDMAVTDDEAALNSRYSDEEDEPSVLNEETALDNQHSDDEDEISVLDEEEEPRPEPPFEADELGEYVDGEEDYDPTGAVYKLRTVIWRERDQRERDAEWYNHELYRQELDFETEKKKLEDEIAELRTKLAESEEQRAKEREAPQDEAFIDRGSDEKLKQAAKETEDALQKQKANHGAKIKQHKKEVKLAKKQHEDELDAAKQKTAKVEQKLDETTKTNSMIASEVEQVVLDHMSMAIALIKEYNDAKAEVKQLLDTPADPAKKTRWSNQQAKSREMEKKFHEFMEEFIQCLYENKYTADGISQIKTWYANESFRPKNLPPPPARPRYTEQDAMKIFKEGRTIGFYDSQIQDDLKSVLRPKYGVQPPEGFEERIRCLRDSEDKNHPTQRGYEAARLLPGVFWAKELQDPALDTCIFKAPQLGMPQILLVDEEKRRSHYWSAFNERMLELGKEPLQRRERMKAQGR